MGNKKKQGLILSILGVLSITLITAGITYAFFNYAGEGTTDNVITTDTITFLYTEVDKVGNGIQIQNAFPKSDELGKVSTKANEYFDFKITSKTASTYAIPYEVTARKSTDSSDIDEYIRVYLTKGATNEEVLLKNYSELTQTSKVDKDKYTEKTIYTGEVPEGSTDYEETFRLRMWLREGTRFENEQMNNKTFKLTVNVYANARVVTQEEIDYESSTEITTLTAGESNLTKVEGQAYDYEATLPEGTTSTTISIETENPNATVTVEKVDSLAKTNNVKRLATTKTLELTNGDNYFKVTVISENRKSETEYKIKITVEKPVKTLSASDALTIGTAVTAKDGSKWHVLEESTSGNEYVTLLSDYNLNSDGTYNTSCGRDINSTYKCSPMLFDYDNTDVYNENDSNNIGYFIKNTYAPKVLSTLPGTTEVTLPTIQQIVIADGQTFEGYNMFDITKSWLGTTSYWTKTSSNVSDYGMWVVILNYAYQHRDYGYASEDDNFGARPVITTSKTNLLAE